MKTNRYYQWLIAAAVAMTGLSVTSCKDQPDKYETEDGTPTIYYIRPVAASAKDSLMTEASMGTTVCIVGDNLRSVVDLKFNDKPAVLNTSYMTDNTLIVTVPKDIPDNVTDKIYFTNNSNETVTFDFHVIIPAPVVSAMSNEWAKAGEEVTIIGDYFLDYESSPLEVKFGDDYTLNRDNIVSITRNRITFTMPADAPHEQVSVTSIFGSTKGSFQYMDNRGMLFDFDTPCNTGVVLSNHGWHARTIQSDDTSLSGNYLVMGDATMGSDGGWNDGNFSFEYWPGNWRDPETYEDYPRLFDIADFSKPGDLNLKFEMCIPEGREWSAAPMQIFFGSTSLISNGATGVSDIYGNKLGGANNTYFHDQGKLSRGLYMPWKDTDDKLYSTNGQWVTVTMPISDFVWDYDGSKITSTYLSANDFAAFCIFIIRGGYNDKSSLPEGVECNPLIKIDNIRVVPNK